jgi:hypothetical protein
MIAAEIGHRATYCTSSILPPLVKSWEGRSRRSGSFSDADSMALGKTHENGHLRPLSRLGAVDSQPKLALTHFAYKFDRATSEDRGNESLGDACPIFHAQIDRGTRAG